MEFANWRIVGDVWGMSLSTSVYAASQVLECVRATLAGMTPVERERAAADIETMRAAFRADIVDGLAGRIDEAVRREVRLVAADAATILDEAAVVVARLDAAKDLLRANRD